MRQLHFSLEDEIFRIDTTVQGVSCLGCITRGLGKCNYDSQCWLGEYYYDEQD